MENRYRWSIKVVTLVFLAGCNGSTVLPGPLDVPDAVLVDFPPDPGQADPGLPDPGPLDAGEPDDPAPDPADPPPDLPDAPAAVPDLPDVPDLPGSVPDLPFDPGSDTTPDVPETIADVVDPLPDLWPIGTVTRTCGKGLLAGVDTPSGPVRIVVLRGTPYELGFQDGCLNGAGVGQFYQPFWALFMDDILKEAAEYGLDPDQVETFVSALIDSVWEQMLPFVPSRYLEERDGFLAGIASDPEAAAQWKDSDPARAWTALLLLSNVSDMYWGGSIENVAQKLSDGFSPALLAWYSEQASGSGDGLPLSLPMKTTCSFFAAWGARTEGGHLFASRNLDWSSDTGMSSLAALVFRAPDAGHPYVTIGYAGFPGALAGMSARGIVVSEVGSTSAMERLRGEPWVLKFRDALQFADDATSGLDLLTGQAGEPKLRPPTIGYNWLLGFGDPPGGTASEAAVLETNGLAIGVHRHDPDCAVSAELVRYAKDGSIGDKVPHDLDPTLANTEAEAVELDKDGLPRKFQVDGDGNPVLDDKGLPVPDPAGKPFPVGKPLACALYRGDEALMHGIRRWQYAANGPQGGAGLMVGSGSYRNRYAVMHGILAAYGNGTAYAHGGKAWVEDHGGVPVPVTLDQASVIARAAALSSNVMSVVYDATDLVLGVSFEKGTKDSWEPASAHEHFRFDLAGAFALLGGKGQ